MKVDASLLAVKEYLTIKETAMLTTYSERMLYQMIKDNEIPYYRPKGRLFIKKSEILGYIASARIPSTRELI